MSKKYLIALAIVVFAFSCKPTEQPAPATDTIKTDTAITSTDAAPPPPPAPKLDHFKFWRLKPGIPYVEAIKLFGQADEKWWDAAVQRLDFIGNPVRKIHDHTTTAPQYQLHYDVYWIKTNPQPTRKVTLSNQFTNNEKQTWWIKDPQWLLVPAGKTTQGAPVPQKGDHFVCYQVLDPKAFGVNLQLQDQFDVLMKDWEQIEQLTPAHFCIPVQKQRKGKEPEKLLDPVTHLALYSFKPEVLPKPINAVSIDQFQTNKLAAVQSVFLGVPSIKYGKPEVTTQPAPK